MTQNLKLLSKDAVQAALEKAERYRLLNEPGEAESICLDVLRIDPENQKAIVTMLLALTDQYDHPYEVTEIQAHELLNKLKSPYDKSYYAGIIAERRAKSKLGSHQAGAEEMAFDLLEEAMSHYEQAEQQRPSGNDDALLRWNTCLRIIERNNLKHKPQQREEQPLE